MIAFPHIAPGSIAAPAQAPRGSGKSLPSGRRDRSRPASHPSAKLGWGESPTSGYKHAGTGASLLAPMQASSDHSTS